MFQFTLLHYIKKKYGAVKPDTRATIPIVYISDVMFRKILLGRLFPTRQYYKMGD
ncbi:hypothetical protein FG05_35089 [Fusarium graminearum]|nr:hypothetical protein FG05_35089 [Fusarium graminearum]